MENHKKLEFIHKMAKLGLQHLDGGGVISAGNSNPLSGIAGSLTAQNSYSANEPTSAQTIGQQQAGLAAQLQNEAAGNGPNPAQQQFQQNVQQIAQQQATTNAQNRAINPGLAARLSGNQAVQSGQQAAAGAGIQQAQQQLAAQGQLQGLTGQEQTGLGQSESINSQVSQNNANAVNNTQGGILSSLPVIGGLFAKGGSVQTPGTPTFSNADNLPDMSHGSSPAAPAAAPGDPFSGMSQPGDISSHAQDMAGIQGGGAAGGMDFGAATSELGSGAAAVALAKGGQVPPKSFAAQWLKNPKMMAGGGMMGEVAQLAPLAMLLAAKGGAIKAKGVPAMVSPGEGYLDPKKTKQVAEGRQNPFKAAEKIPGHAKVKGDSYKNDTVPKMLKDGGMVLPRHIMAHPKAPEKAAEFVRAHLARKGLQAK